MRSILVVATDPEVRASTARTLQDLGYTVESRREPDKAVERVRQRHPAAVIVDARLASDSCSAFVEACRREVSAAEMPILVVSAGPHAVVDAIRAGAQGCVSKPVQPATLVPMLYQIHMPRPTSFRRRQPAATK
jgi:CheY-like chemotaxis protein